MSVLQDLVRVTKMLIAPTVKVLSAVLANRDSPEMVQHAEVCEELVNEPKKYLGYNFRVPKNPHFQSEANCKTFLVKMSFICMKIKIIFLSLAVHVASKNKHGATRKWPIDHLGIRDLGVRDSLH